jgi:hypothetical protein
MKTECTTGQLVFQGFDKRPVEVRNTGEANSSDGGLLLLRHVEQSRHILSRLATFFKDARNPLLIKHSVEQMLTQRILGLCQGYEDINDHETLRLDPVMNLICGREFDPQSPLAGKSTLNRLELGRPEEPKRRYQKITWDNEGIQGLLVDLFTEVHEKPPAEIILDIDSTDDPVHGEQEGRFFHGYYDEWCYLPLYVFCGEHLLWAELRSADTEPAVGALPALRFIIGRIRERWPHTRIIVRGDGGFCRSELMDWIEAQVNTFYVFGLAGNKRLTSMVVFPLLHALKRSIKTNKPVRIFRDLRYKPRKTWPRERRVVAKAEQTLDGPNPRFIVTNLSKRRWGAKALYEKLYCARGNMENRIKEQQLYLFADRTSSHTMHANQLRLWLSSFAYVFMVAIRQTGLAATGLAQAQCHTIRLKLLKVAATVRYSARRILVTLPQSFPYWDYWKTIQDRFRTAGTG